MRFAIKDAGNILFINRATNVPMFYTEDANSFEFKMSADAIYAKAKGNKAIAFDGEITCEAKIEFEVIQFAQLSVLLASDLVEKDLKTAEVAKGRLDSEKKLKIKNKKAIDGSIIAFSLKEDGQEFDKKLEVTSQVTGADTHITVTTQGIEEGAMVLVYFQTEKKKARTLTLTADGKAPSFRIETDVAVKDTFEKMSVMHLSIKNAKPKRNFEFNLATDNPTKFPMELDCFPDEMGEYAELTFIDDSGASVASLVDKILVNDKGEKVKLR